ncbi:MULTISPECIES: Lin1244/Lin1753 domain-containing protein [unclassified Sedimentibacter]|uniref:Lin1244/Lin1753 domain-containing protein n=1 Tax=unclassified Sedimentibacter TaxID=2649220 RepID=UPI0027DF4A49|nr:Lin1244/Lin1753 domain-containing protein [Sedimentibacter sp. MB35-C1]WMJ78460.1 DUF4373 domain-containing protein [Sedimentibacter sp. MB35-C1]
MARPKKQTVEYFPHYTTSGKTLFILESNYGNNGYAFWFKLLELLGGTNGMYYDCNNVPDLEFLLAKTHVNKETAYNILNILADLETIDKELWYKSKIIWCQNLINNVTDAFKRRISEIPKKPLLHTETPMKESKCIQKPSASDISTDKNGESKVKESKVNNKKNNVHSANATDAFFETVWKLYPNKKGKTAVSKKSKDAIYKLGIEKITAAIESYKKELAKETWKQPMNGSTFFNGRFTDYLSIESEKASPTAAENKTYNSDDENPYANPELMEQMAREAGIPKINFDDYDDYEG